MKTLTYCHGQIIYNSVNNISLFYNTIDRISLEWILQVSMNNYLCPNRV